MMQKLVVPVAAVVLAALAGIAIWFLMDDTTPHPIATSNEAGNHAPAPDSPAPLKADDFDATRLQPDPLTNQRPDQPFNAPEKTVRVIISGRVITDGGVGVADAHVLVLGGAGGRIIPRGNARTSGLRGSGYTDASGFYRLLAWSADAPTGNTQRATFAAETPDGGVAVAENIEIPDAPTFAMEDLVVAAGSVIEGQVLSADGQPAPGAEITARSSGPVMVATLDGRTPSARRRQFVTTVFADANGTYRIANLPPGLYGINVFAGYFGATPKRIEVDVRNSPQAWQEIRLDGEGMIRGVLTDNGAVPIPGAVVRLAHPPAKEGDNQPVNELRRADFRDAASLRDNRAVSRFADLQVNSRMHCVTDAAGRFGFIKPPAGELQLISRIGTAEAKLENVTPGPDDYRMQIDVATSIGGIVRDAETSRVIERFDARVIPGKGSSENSPFEIVAENGRFEFHPGGQYGFANPTTGTLQVRICAPGYAPAVVAIEDVKEGDSRRDIDVSLKPLCRLNARLVRDGRALDLEPCALLFDDRLAYETSSDEIGRVRIPDVTPATYKVTVVLTDGSELVGNVVVPAKHETELDITVGPAK